jgi:hypothetical protein
MTGRLHPDDLAQLAALVLSGLAQALSGPDGDPASSDFNPTLGNVGKHPGGGPDTALLTAAQVAERYAVTPEWVRDHADELGAVRLGSGPRPRLRFDSRGVEAWIAARSTGEGSSSANRARRRARSDARASRTSSGRPLLPVKGLER